MKKSATLITTALLTFGLAAASMAADAPKSGTPAAADSTAPRVHEQVPQAQHQQEAQEVFRCGSCGNQVI